MKKNYIQRKGVWLDTRNHKTYSCKVNEHCEYFDSKAEHECWQIIHYWLLSRNYYNKHFILTRQHKLFLPNGKSWKVDFRLKATSIKAGKMLNTLSDGYASNEYYIEFKGIIDDNFSAKITDMLANKDANLDSLLLISYNPTAFVYEDLQKMEIAYKLIYSLKWLKQKLLSL